MEFHKLKIIYYSLLYFACLYGDMDLVKYFISLNKFDLTEKIEDVCLIVIF